jgi:hypothetical protein
MFMAALAPAHTETRVALVIGNGAYQRLQPLKNPPNDARDLADALKKLDFDVDLGVDLTLSDMQRKVAAFARRAQAADVALAFFAGHGVQAPDPLGSANAVNYLLPIDGGDIREAADLSADFLVTARDILARLQGASSVRILIMDACRHNPIPQRLARSARSPAIHRGLAAEPRTSGTLIAYSTQPDATAEDGDDRNSPFMKSLLANIAEPGQDIRLLFADVRRDVIQRSNGAQTPETSDSLDGRFAFKKAETMVMVPSALPAAPPPVPPLPAVPAADEVAWSYLKDIGNAQQLHRFIAQFPASPRRKEAEERIKMLEQANVVPAPPMQGIPSQGHIHGWQTTLAKLKSSPINDPLPAFATRGKPIWLVRGGSYVVHSNGAEIPVTVFSAPYCAMPPGNTDVVCSDELANARTALTSSAVVAVLALTKRPDRRWADLPIAMLLAPQRDISDSLWSKGAWLRPKDVRALTLVNTAGRLPKDRFFWIPLDDQIQRLAPAAAVFCLDECDPDGPLYTLDEASMPGAERVDPVMGKPPM